MTSLERKCKKFDEEYVFIDTGRTDPNTLSPSQVRERKRLEKKAALQK